MDAFDIGFIIGFIVGALVMGFLVGLAPLILGVKRGRVGLGVTAIILCIIGNFIAGIFLSIPISIIFIIVILVLPRKQPEQFEQPESPESFYRQD